MPRVFKIGPYLVYFWSDEMEPLEPVHVHVSQGEPQRDSTKVWLTKVVERFFAITIREFLRMFLRTSWMRLRPGMKTS